MSRRTVETGPPFVGVDVLRIDELDRLMHRRWFRHLLYSTAERREAGTLAPSRRREFLAGRFAGKEAVLKMLGVGLLSRVPAWQIDIGRTEDGAPQVRLADAAARRAADAGLDRIALSISHKENLVIAVAMGWAAATPEHADTTAQREVDRALDAEFAQRMAHGSLLTKRRALSAD
ncbi:4'-phosphopantetheinyl transferase superfamily protein [Streptomyces sp. NPDC006476]|uniref:holo-ACP synthase n=1 Tax=Streptomyces sp. NPDC006476 TaxID=3157175 RepID=UPI0033B746A5